MLAPLAFVFFLSFRVYKMSVGAAQIAFWLFAGVMGLSLSSIFLVFTGQSITQVFFVTAAAFGGLSLYGYTTKRDLSGWGTFLFMGVIGVVIASLVNLFLQSSALQFAISVIGVLVFAGLTAYDTQRIKDGYYRGDGRRDAGWRRRPSWARSTSTSTSSTCSSCCCSCSAIANKPVGLLNSKMKGLAMAGPFAFVRGLGKLVQRRRLPEGFFMTQPGPSARAPTFPPSLPSTAPC